MVPYDIVDAFEKKVAEYAGAKYGVAVNSCTNALMLAAMYRSWEDCIFNNSGEVSNKVYIPKYTYVGVPYAMLNAGFKIDFVDMDWTGAYPIEPIGVVDAARRFYRGMYEPGTLYCLSFHWYKHLPVGRGGMILTDDYDAMVVLKQMRYDGRTGGVAPTEDNFYLPAHHCYLIPEDAARGLMLMGNVKDYNEDIPWDHYADLSQYPIFTEVYNV